MAVEQQLQPSEEILYRAHPTLVDLIPSLAAAALAAVGGLVAWQTLPAYPVLPMLEPVAYSK